MAKSPKVCRIGKECVACGCCVRVCPKEAVEIVCGIARRVPRVYLQNGSVCKIWNDLEEH